MANDYRQMAYQSAQKYRINPNIFVKLIGVETGDYNPDVISGRIDSPAGARGIAQLMPVHWNAVDPLNPPAALDYAASLIAGFLEQYDGDYAKALAAYNAGPGAVEKYGGVPPFAETQTYVSKIMAGNQPAQGGAPMAEPQPLGSPQEFWIDYTKLDSKGQPTVYTTKPADNPGIFGIGASVSPAVHVSRVTFDNGEIYDFTDDGKSTYVRTDPQLATAYRAAIKDTTPPPHYFQDAAGGEAVYDPNTGETKNLYTPPPKRYEPGSKPYLPGYDEAGDPVRDPQYDWAKKELQDRLLRAQIAREERLPVPADNSVAWATLAQRKAEFEAEQRAKQEAAERAWQQFLAQQEREDARNRLTNTTNFTNDILSTWTKAAPQAMLPGQQYFLGAEPGGLASRWAEMNRHAFDPNLLKPMPIQVDPNEAWRQANAVIGGGK